ncbi:KpsF/GutQ family sugar-phosphate isomerase [Lentilactobacillus hilgardii]|uniref:KpsF/GutQ family sugar-phosphate isomerase n=1 Tax=Lentilactobacillus hilgardii TaxID=1588 RepID=A0A6P1EB72_LENHI|nr:KpsF/GutQ family sugar-phosphate isomerase [Lentilactobacillus hilgardii]MCT3390611.1 KpsF/GutQ family sugar-phosphate isomerase [Lentilactobacillus hilgardii]QHB52855.1 KpsF/GutQ family sugar-phosphate isomerase [Lentilactobacillus hilgardii]
MAYYELAQDIFESEKQALDEVSQRLDEHFDDLVNMINETTGRVIFIGNGKSEIIAEKISASLSSIGQSSFTIDAATAFHGDLGRLAKNDTVLLVSNSGETQEVVQTLFAMKTIFPNGISTVALTGNPNSTLAKNTDLVINLSVKKEADVTGLAPTSSTTATLVLGDALLVALEKIRSFDKKQFAQYHPGGSIGKMLLQQVKHVMHTKIPYVEEDTKINDVIYTISNFGLGITLVRDIETNQITGIVTDGDIRKKFLDVPAVKRSTARDYMTRGFVSINQEKRNRDAWRMMASRNISNLIVRDNDDHVVGVITIHDVL